MIKNIVQYRYIVTKKGCGWVGVASGPRIFSWDVGNYVTHPTLVPSELS